MFNNLTQRLANAMSQAIKNLTGQNRLTEENIQSSLSQIRMALLEADVALPVVKELLSQIREKAIGQTVPPNLNPGQIFIKIVHDEIVQQLTGEQGNQLNLKTQPPAVLLLAGLQGSGKTTTAAKLAKWIHDKLHKKVLLASTDIYRPAAIAQLKILADEIHTDCYPSQIDQKPVDIAQNALLMAKQKGLDVLIIDTAGRLHIDEQLMAELKDISLCVNPSEILFVADSMTGQDAANTAHAFNRALALTGVILTKTDGDARGGAALSIRHITGKPIKFMGTGEKIPALEIFYPDRIASQILGMGDILSLVEKAQENIDQAAAIKLAQKLNKGKFDLEDFRSQLLQLRKLGGISHLMEKLPGFGALPVAAKQQVNDKSFIRIIAIIDSMTLQERRFPDLIRASRKKRIAAGSGTQISEINQLLKQYEHMQRMMKRLKGGGLFKMMKNMKGMFPPGNGSFPPAA